MRKVFTLFLIITASSFLKPVIINAQVNVQDSLALVDLYNSTNGPGWYNHTNWLTSAPVSNWYGITLTSNRVTTLNLSGNTLSGSLPTSIGKLTNLNVLDLSGNLLIDTIPSSIGNLINLTQLSFLSNHLSGNIPSSLSKLANVWNLNLGENQLSGNIPSSLSKLKNLYLLLLSVNQLSGSIPPSLGNLTNLGALELSDNQFNGVIPSSLSKLTKLSELTLSDNQLSGNINFLGNLKELGYLDLNNNNLSGNLEVLSQLDTLGYISLNHNQFTGSVPNFESRNGIFASGLTLDLSYNNLQGTITHQFDSLTNISYLSFRLNNNEITGRIPTIVSKLIGLYDIDLSNNKLTGKIPSLDILKNLNNFNISNNQLSGGAPTFSTLAYIYAPHIENNQFTFAGMENFAKYNAAVYAPQANINIIQNGNILSVSAGGTLANNTYSWFKNGKLFKTITGDSTLVVHKSADYYVDVTNSVATALTLHSDTINYIMAPNPIIAQVNNENKILKAQVYPNPATTNATFSFYANGKYSITVTDASGKNLETKNGIAIKGINSIQLDVSNYANGIYFIHITDESNLKQTFTLNKQ